MFKEVFGSESAGLVLVEILEKGSCSPYSLAKNRGIGLKSAQDQLEKWLSVGVLVCKDEGRAWVYRFNDKSALLKPLKTLIKAILEK